MKALEQRLKLIDMAPSFPVPCFDLAAALLPRKVDYATKQGAIETELLKDCGLADGRLFCVTRKIQIGGLSIEQHAGSGCHCAAPEKKVQSDASPRCAQSLLPSKRSVLLQPYGSQRDLQ